MMSEVKVLWRNNNTKMTIEKCAVVVQFLQICTAKRKKRSLSNPEKKAKKGVPWGYTHAHNPDLACNSTKMELHRHFAIGKERNTICCHNPLPSVNDVLDMAENESKENAIFIAQRELIGSTISH
jgi:hypothetical protein